MPRIWYLWKILAAGYQLCLSRGTWTQLPHSAQCQYFASGALVCSHLNFWHPLAACDQRHYCHLWMIFFIEPLESEEPVSCLELKRAQPSHFLAKAFGKEHSLCPSKHSGDIWVHIWQMGTDGSAWSCPRPARVGLGIVARSKAVESWVSTCMISPHQGMWPGAAVPPWNRQQDSVGLHKP